LYIHVFVVHRDIYSKEELHCRRSPNRIELKENARNHATCVIVNSQNDSGSNGFIV
jgi:hypothetical protein